MKKIHFIINPISGINSKERIPALIQEHFDQIQFEIKISTTEYAGHAIELTKNAVSEGTHYVVAVGGDGTVNEVAKSMVHTPASLGIIPVGSGNGLARDLRIPLDMKKAMEVISKGNTTQIDYCKANNNIFFCTCGVGFDALVSERFSEEKHRGSISYLKSIINEFIKFRSENYEVILDKETIKEKALLITCANASQYGYNAYIAPHASIHDGKMDIAIMSPLNPMEVGPLAIQLFTKRIDKNNKLSYYRSQSVVIKRQKAGPMHIDGSPIQMGRKITVKTIPAGLNVIVPLKEDIESALEAQIFDIQSFFRELLSWIANATSSNKNLLSK